jgi:hypothetical protein
MLNSINLNSSIEITTTPLQIALLNNMLPRGFRLEAADVLRKNKRKKSTHRLDTDFPHKRHYTRERHSKDFSQKSEPLTRCKDIFNQLKEHPHAKYFFNPNTPTSNSLSSIEQNIKEGKYEAASEFAGEIRSVWNSCWANSKPGSEVYIAITEIALYFESLIKEVEQTLETSDKIQELQKQVRKANDTLRKLNDSTLNIDTYKQMSERERAVLAQKIRKLDEKQLVEMLQIIKNEVDFSNADNELELDLKTLSSKACHQLEKYVKHALTPYKNKRAKFDSTTKSIESPLKTAAEEQRNC